MSRFSDPLSRVKVASPCPADWDSMIGDQRVRFCGQCELKVYNLSAMTRTQAEDLIGGTEGRLCVRFYRRRDGSILTQDCPVGLRRLKQRMSRIRKAVAGALIGFFGGAAGTYAVNQLGSDMIERHTVGVMAVKHDELHPVPAVDTPMVGMAIVDPEDVQRIAVPRKRKRR